MRSFQRARILVPLLLTVFACFVPQARALWDCGMRKITTEKLIMGGEKAKEGSFPWHAAIYHWNGSTFNYQCGGSIIDSNVILTSAHCIYTQNGLKKTSDIRVELGRTELNSTIDPAQVYNVTMLIPHDNYRPGSVSDDIALIQLGSEIKMTNFIQPICIWNDDSRLDIIVGRNGSVVGFGQTELEKTSNHLREALIEVADSWTCIESEPAVYGQNLNSKMFCGRGSKNVSPCKGDSGGGLVFKIEGRWSIRGIVSFIPSRDRFGSCDITKYTVFMDVAKYRQWMKKYVQLSVMSVSNEFVYDVGSKLKLFNLQTCGVALNKTDLNVEEVFIPYPWLGWLEIQHFNQKVQVTCHVTLINEWYAVGPAHCFSDVSVRYRVLLGIEDIDTLRTCLEDSSYICPYRRSIKAVFKHPGLNLTSFTHNIALIELAEPANVTPICLAVTTELHSNTPTPMVFSSLVSLSEYQERNANYVNVTFCQNQYKSKGYQLNIDYTQFCASLDESDYNAPGAPIQAIETFGGSERFVLRGFTILDLNDENIIPSVFSNIDSYLPWVLYKMKNKTFTYEKPRFQNATWNSLDLKNCGMINDTKYTFPWIGVLTNDFGASNSYNRLRLVILISEWYAISHTFHDFNFNDSLHVILGDIELLYDITCINHLNQKQCDPPIQALQIERIINHPAYGKSRLENDISLAILLEPADITKPHVRPICLPFAPKIKYSEQTNLTFVFINDGFELRKSLTYISPEECKLRLEPASYFSLHKHTELCVMCKKGYCSGYSIRFSYLHAAYRHMGLERYFLIGLKYPDHFPYLNPSMFEYVGKHNDWILSNIRNRTNYRSEEIRKKIIENDLETAKRNAYNSFQLGLLDFHKCGIRNGDIKMLADSDTFPWIGLLFQEGNNSSPCHVTLISEWYALAPGICFNGSKADRHLIQFGILRNPGRAVLDEEIYHRVKEVIRIDGHHNKKEHHVALILLEKPVNTTTSNVKPICLPILRSYTLYNPTEMIVATYQTGRNTFKSFNTTYVSDKDCLNRWDTLKERYDIIDESNILLLYFNEISPEDYNFFELLCALRNLSKEEDACTDVASGAPLQTLHNVGGVEQYVLRGLFANQEPNCSLRKPDFYINVHRIVGKIINNMKFNYDLSEMLVFPLL